jgi:hypothetical protein
MRQQVILKGKLGGVFITHYPPAHLIPKGKMPEIEFNASKHENLKELRFHIYISVKCSRPKNYKRLKRMTLKYAL